jgi:hypothetical protein
MSCIAPGRPSELPDDTLAKIELLYKHNVPATVIANKFQLSRQRVYYYFKKFYLMSVPRLPSLSVDDILSAQHVTQQESLNG